MGVNKSEDCKNGDLAGYFSKDFLMFSVNKFKLRNTFTLLRPRYILSESVVFMRSELKSTVQMRRVILHKRTLRGLEKIVDMKVLSESHERKV